MGNKITRISRKPFKNKKKKSKNNGQNTAKEPECQCSLFPNTATTPTCIKCVSGIMQEIETNRSNGKRAIYSGHWRIIENSTVPISGSQFDVKKFDKVFKSHQQYPPQIDESENDDSEFEDAQSDTLQSEPSERSKKHSEELQDDDNNSNNNSYSSIFDVFEKWECDALLSKSALDEMFFYPAIGEAVECDGFNEKYEQIKKLTPIETQLNGNRTSFSSINDEKQFDETNKTDDPLFDETHIYDTVASSEEFDNMIRKDSQNQSLNVRQLKSFKDDDSKSKELPFHATHFDATQQKTIPFNATQFDTRQIDNSKYDGILFNDSQFDAKYFDATEPCFVTQLKKYQISVSKLDPVIQLNTNRPFKKSQFNALEFNAKQQFKTLESKGAKLDDNELLNVAENQCDDAKLSSTLINNAMSDVTEFEAALIRTAQFVASHFGAERSNGTHLPIKNFNAAPFRKTKFNASEFDAKQFLISQFNTTQLDVPNFDSRQFTASQFDAMAFKAQKCGKFIKNRSRLDKSQISHDNCLNVTEFDAKLYNAAQYGSRQVYAT